MTSTTANDKRAVSPLTAAKPSSQPSLFDLRDALTLAGLLSLSRVVLAALFPLVTHLPWLALAVIAVAGISDVLDGYVARRRGAGTPTGAALDPLTDKIFASSVMLSLLLRDQLSLAGAALLSVRELLELPLLLWLLWIPRARAAKAAHLKANLLGKLTTLLQFGALIFVLFGLSHSGVWLAATALVGTLAAVFYWAGFIRAVSCSASAPA